MSKLQYIKLFEAFESVKLTKTLGYIEDKTQKKTFLDRLKRICNSIDFPYSKWSTYLVPPTMTVWPALLPP